MIIHRSRLHVKTGNRNCLVIGREVDTGEGYTQVPSNPKSYLSEIGIFLSLKLNYSLSRHDHILLIMNRWSITPFILIFLRSKPIVHSGEKNTDL